MRRAVILLILLSLLLTGCAAAMGDHASPQTAIATSAQPTAESIDAPQYRAVQGSVSISANGIYTRPIVNWLNSASLQPDGGILCGDGAGLLPDSGGVIYDSTLEKPRQLVKENQPLWHNGSVSVTIDSSVGHRATYNIYDSNYKHLEEYGYSNALPDDGKLPLPRQPGLYLVSLAVSWSAPRQYPGAQGRESVCYEYVFLVEYETAGPT